MSHTSREVAFRCLLSARRVLGFANTDLSKPRLPSYCHLTVHLTFCAVMVLRCVAGLGIRREKKNAPFFISHFISAISLFSAIPSSTVLLVLYPHRAFLGLQFLWRSLRPFPLLFCPQVVSDYPPSFPTFCERVPYGSRVVEGACQRKDRVRINKEVRLKEEKALQVQSRNASSRR